jgi:hypothetical protein
MNEFPELKEGSNGLVVTKVKAILQSQGLWNGTTSPQFGPKLKAAVQYFQSTHLAEDGQYLDDDGVVGPDTWWALYNPSGPAQRSYINQPDTKGFYGNLVSSRKAQLKILFAEHKNGTAEIPDGSNGGDGVEKFIQGYGHVPWCALFQSWAWKEATGQWPLRARQASVQDFWESAVDRGVGFAKANYSPVPGDLMVWKFSGGTGHISAIVSTNLDGSVFNTIGGNEGNRVKLGKRVLADEPRCVGFINLHNDLAIPKKWTKSIFESGAEPKLDDKSTR